MTTRAYLGWPMTPMVKRLLIILASVWLAEVVCALWLGIGAIVDHLALTPVLVYPGLELWQPFTYMWLHSPANFLHILLNGLFLWMFGGSLELAWGGRAFLKFYLICGLGAGLIVFAAGLVFDPETKVLGASGAIYGLVIAWAIAFPNRLIYLFGLFPIKGKHFVLIPIGFAVLEFLTRAEGVSHTAHLGGMAIGALLVTGYWRPGKAYRQLRYRRLRRRLRMLEGERQGGEYYH